MSVSQDVLGEIASYVSEARLTEARSELNIQALSLSYDIAASHWFLQHVLSNAYNLEGITEHNDNRVEALYVLVKDDVTYVVRAVAIKSGKRIILAEYLAPQEAWENERVLSTQAMQGFDLLNKDDSYVQALKNFKFLDVAEFSYPERWEIRTPTIRSTDRMEAKILNVNRTMKVLNGQIEVYVVSAAIVDSLEEELLRLKEVLTQKQLDLGELIETHPDFKFDENMKFGIVEAYEANNKDLKLIEYELWIAIMSSDTNYYFIPLLTPRRTEEFTTWSRNIGDFRIVVENMKPIVNKPALEQWQPQGGKTAAGASQ